MDNTTVAAGAGRILLFAGAIIAAGLAHAEDPKTPYPSMLPLDQYLMPDRQAEIRLARTAAPSAISEHAAVLVLSRHGYEEAVKGSNGFTCIVERSWMSPMSNAGFWNPKNRSPICYNPPATRSILPYTIKITELAIARLSKNQINDRIHAIVARKELPLPEPGAMSYMMSKEGYLGDDVGHWHPHLMFHIPKTDPASWGANLHGSPVVLDPSELAEPETIFMIPVGTWSDGTPFVS
ncbi:MAG TPA: hypothetical protein VGJ20_19115 [Xanthobacteraceae bacterium]|jgi:hypothetical protein